VLIGSVYLGNTQHGSKPMAYNSLSLFMYCERYIIHIALTNELYKFYRVGKFPSFTNFTV